MLRLGPTTAAILPFPLQCYLLSVSLSGSVLLSLPFEPAWGRGEGSTDVP